MAIGNTTPPGDSPEFGARFPKRDFYLMVYLLMGIGLRRHEILTLKAQSIDLQKRILTVTSRKTMNTRKVPISPVLAGILAAYLQEREPARLAAMKWLDRLRRLRP